MCRVCETMSSMERLLAESGLTVMESREVLLSLLVTHCVETKLPGDSLDNLLTNIRRGWRRYKQQDTNKRLH